MSSKKQELRDKMTELRAAVKEERQAAVLAEREACVSLILDAGELAKDRARASQGVERELLLREVQVCLDLAKNIKKRGEDN